MDLFSSNSQHFLAQHNMIQLIHEPTHIFGGTLDLILTTRSVDVLQAPEIILANLDKGPFYLK
jgi:hypothetical protein